jgi:hypothetical protein
VPTTPPPLPVAPPEPGPAPPLPVLPPLPLVWSWGASIEASLSSAVPEPPHEAPVNISAIAPEQTDKQKSAWRAEREFDPLAMWLVMNDHPFRLWAAPLLARALHVLDATTFTPCRSQSFGSCLSSDYPHSWRLLPRTACAVKKDHRLRPPPRL